MSDKLSELLPCPFCGTAPTNAGIQGIWCNNDACAIVGMVFSGGPRHWNRRASPAPAISVVDEEAVIEKCAALADSMAAQGYPANVIGRDIRALKAAPAISESEDALLTAARRAIPALAHAAERNPVYQRDYEELSKAIEVAARKGEKS
ncbi:hypothetical protein [Burkholderia gladioli]|uniref:hypothetical protein n=1 Tax=Burkholderia gladioli TaxID=28095 RepID=UPI00163E970A|nr:hypothetical protein [Burkholderia gladioli]